MENYCTNRLTIVGPAKDIARLEDQSDWPHKDHMLHAELMRRSPCRHIWQFDSIAPPLQFIVEFSKKWEALTFLLDFDLENKRIKGIAKAFRGRFHHHMFNYGNRK